MKYITVPFPFHAPGPVTTSMGTPQRIRTLWPQRCALSRRGLYSRPRAGPALILRARCGRKEEAVGHRGARFRARTHPLSGPEQSGNGWGKFQFSIRNQHFRSKPIFRYWYTVHTTATQGSRPPSQAVERLAGALGHRSARFRARTHPLSAPGQPGNDLGEFDFRSKTHHYHGLW